MALDGPEFPAIGNPTGIAPVLQVHPTRHCNLACAHCYSESGPSARGQLGLSMLAACLEDAVALGYRQLAVSGGEPLLYAQLPELLSRAKELGMLTSITTNGMLAASSTWGRLSGHLDVAAVSIDGTEAEHDALRGRVGAFAKTVRNLAVIRESGVPFGFIFTLTRYNADSMESVVRLAARCGARSVQVHPLTPTGRAAASLSGDWPDDLELLAALAEAARLGRETGVAVHVDAVHKAQLSVYRHRLVPARPVANLALAAPVLIVQADAAVVPLTHDIGKPLWLGSLRENPLRDLAQAWLAAGYGDRLATACEEAWSALSARTGREPAAAYWYGEVAARARGLDPACA